jgi:hypothetical protein
LEYALRRLIIFSLLLVGAASAQVVPGILRHANYEAPPDEGTWSYVELGAGTCNTVSDSAGTLTITAAGVDVDNACFVYETVEATPTRLGAQVYGRISSISGTAAATALTGAMIANNSTNTAAHCVTWWNASQSKVKGAVRAANGTTSTGGIDGNATTLPAHVGTYFVDSTNRCRLFDNDTATIPANPETDFWGVPQPQIAFSSDMSDEFLAGFFLRSGHATNTATVTITDYDVTNSPNLVDNFSTAAMNYYSDFETGTIQDRNETHDGWLRQTMDAANPGGSYSYSDQVLQSDGAVSPRAGDYMLRLETRAGDNPLLGDFSPRSQVVVWKDAYEIPYTGSQTHYIGWSTYLPSSDFNPSDTMRTAQIHINDAQPAYVWQFSYDSALGAYKSLAWYYPGGGNAQELIRNSQLGNQNPITAYFDEWVDWRIEIRISNNANGRLILWRRRAEITNTYTKVVDYSGPLGRRSGDGHAFMVQIYGGPHEGGSEWPIIAYHDEIRISNSAIAVKEDVDPEPIAP